MNLNYKLIKIIKIMAGIFRKKLIDSGKVLSEAPFLYERIILTTTTTGCILGCTGGTLQHTSDSFPKTLINSIEYGFGGCVMGFIIGVASPLIIPVSAVGLIISSVACGCKTINEKIN
jgi:hypothetical protein